MKKFLSIALSGIITGFALTACVKDVGGGKEPLNLDPHHITQEQALQTMGNAMAQLYSGTRAVKSYTVQTLKGRDLRRNSTRSEIETPLPEDLLYIVNFDNDEGFAVLAADDRIPPLLALTESGSLLLDDFTSIDPTDTLAGLKPSQFIGSMMVQYVERKVNDGLDELAVDWEGNPIDTTTYNPPVPPVNFVKPLLKTKWGQDSPFNNKIDVMYQSRPGAPVKRMPIGCTTAAFVQVLAYYEKPSVSYFGITNPAITWETLKDAQYMPETQYYAPQYNAIATICKKITDPVSTGGAGAVFTNAGGGMTGLSLPNVATYAKNKLGYSSATVKNKDVNMDMTLDILNDIVIGRPVIVAGWEQAINHSPYGHTFVVDGYVLWNYLFTLLRPFGFPDITITLPLMHVNWGWYGSSDGYYLWTILALDAQFDVNEDGEVSGLPTGTINNETYYGYNGLSVLRIIK